MVALISPRDYEKEAVDRLPSLFQQDEIQKALLGVLCHGHTQLANDLTHYANNILSIDLAKGTQLDMIGSLIGQSRELIDFDVEKYFGFLNSYNSDTFGTVSDPNVGGLWNSLTYNNIAKARKLTDEEYRRVIKARSIKNTSNCSINDILEVCNLLTNNTDTVLKQDQDNHRVLKINYTDTVGLMPYFLDRINLDDGVIPVAFGVRIESVEI